jgi:hypothetical protein
MLRPLLTETDTPFMPSPGLAVREDRRPVVAMKVEDDYAETMAPEKRVTTLVVRTPRLDISRE